MRRQNPCTGIETKNAGCPLGALGGAGAVKQTRHQTTILLRLQITLFLLRLLLCLLLFLNTLI